MLTFGVFGKCGALFVTIPDPIVGGVFIVMFGEAKYTANKQKLFCQKIIIIYLHS